MNISHVVQRYFPAISGSELYFQKISEHLIEKHKIKVLCSNALDFRAFGTPKGKIIESKYSQINNVPIFRFPIKYSYFINKFPLIEYKTIKKLLKQIGRFRNPLIDAYNLLINGPYCPDLLEFLLSINSDIIHSTCFPFATNLFALIAGKMKRVPTLTTPFFHFANKRYQNPSLLRILKFFDMILVCSKLEAQYIINHGGIKRFDKKIKLIKMGVDIKKFTRAKPKKLRQKFGINSKPLVLFCGYKNYEKGAIHILKSIKYVIKRVPDVVFMFIGPSTKAFNIEKGKLKSDYKKHIINIGVVPYDNIKIKISSFMASDIYVMPSRSDAYGIAFLEAFACKKPVIGANIGATPEIIQNNHNGILVPFGAPNVLGNAIVRLLKNPGLRDELGYNGYQKIKNQTWENVSKKIEEIYLSFYE
ncbi:MAG: glycosyltransferase family 4 protein [Candidatus Helarchaeota archaeon]